MKNVIPISGTANSSPEKQSSRVPANSLALDFLGGDEKTYTDNLIKDWHAQLVFLEGLKANSALTHRDNLVRLLNHAKLAPWQLGPQNVTHYFQDRADARGGKPLAPSSVAVMCAAWRSFQNYMLEMERLNEISGRFGVRPRKFVNDENSIAVKRHKLNALPRSWALSPEQIASMDQAYCAAIRAAAASHSKSLLPLQRDRVMFHLCIHFALRVSELVTVRLSDFRGSHDPQMARFGNFGVLTVTGKNDVTGSVPMREPMIHNLLRWYLAEIRPKLLLRRKDANNGTCSFGGKDYRTAELLFPSERGAVVEPNQIRKRLKQMAMNAGTITQKITPHVLRHTGCTLMVPIYSPEIAQKYMRHKNLYTTLGYYHPSPLKAGNEVNAALALFEDEEE